MALDSCLVPTSNMTFGEIFYCIGLLTFGSIQLAAIVLFITISYLMWKIGVPVQVSAPFGVILLFVLGSATYATDPSFTNLLWLFIIVIAALFVVAILHFTRR